MRECVRARARTHTHTHTHTHTQLLGRDLSPPKISEDIFKRHLCLP